MTLRTTSEENGMVYEYAIIGKGMIGTAAARYVSKSSDSIVLIGPDEPDVWPEHEGVFSSHYDQGRITRELDSTFEWALWAQRSIAEYRSIEKQSGIEFYNPCGSIQVGLTDGTYLPRTEEIALHLGTNYKRYSNLTFANVVPEFNFSDQFSILHEPTIAGYVNPRQLVQAQVACCEQQGADVIRETVTRLDARQDWVELTTDDGQQIAAKKVLVAAGAWTEFLTGLDVGLIPTPRTVLLAKLDSAETERLKHLPSVVFYEGIPNPHLSGVYILPPIKYPNGNTYLKIGGKMIDIPVPKNSADLEAYFHTNGRQNETDEIERELFNIIPSLRAESLYSRPCVVTNQKEGHMLVLKEIIDGRVMVAAAGCGSAAKSSNEIGRIASVKLMQL
ncbi:MAG: FAD-dependent oxidoreductase [Chloroflexota bacterium]